MVMRNYFIFCLMFLFVFNFVSAEDSILKGKLYDNINILENDVEIQSYIDKISEETGAVVIIYMLDTIDSDLKTWGNSIGKQMRLGDVGVPKKNVLIGYFKSKNAVYVTSKEDGDVNTDLRSRVSSLILSAIKEEDSDKFLDALKVLGEGLGVKESEVEEGEKKVLTMKECKEILEQRKEDLKIPEKFCYWEAMTELYDEKCENLDGEEISEIFEKKAAYRELENEDWPSLNTDGDFCVDVVYDCEEWEKIPRLPFMSDYETKAGKGPMGIHYKGTGFERQRFFINPFLVISPEEAQIYIIHEGLHSIQDEEFSNRNSLYSMNMFSNDFVEAYPEYIEDYKSLRKAKEIFSDLTKIIVDEDTKIRKVLYVKPMENCAKKFEKDYDPDSPYWKCVKPILDLTGELTEDYEEFIGIFKSGSVLEINDFSINSDNRFYDFYKDDEEFNLKFSLLKKTIPLNIVKILKIITAITYTSTIVELDPRLSEIHRWWFDKTGPENCEIIETHGRAREVFDKFLSEENIAEEYSLTQEQLKDVMEIAKKLGKEQEIYDKLVNRLPGIAYVEPVDDGSNYA